MVTWFYMCQEPKTARNDDIWIETDRKLRCLVFGCKPVEVCPADPANRVVACSRCAAGRLTKW